MRVALLLTVFLQDSSAVSYKKVVLTFPNKIQIGRLLICFARGVGEIDLKVTAPFKYLTDASN